MDFSLLFLPFILGSSSDCFENFEIHLMTNIIRYSILFLIFSLTVVCIESCEQSRTVPFHPPVYKPQLIFFAVAGPQSGAHVIVIYNEPFDGLPGKVPPVPDLEVKIVGSNHKEFVLRQDSVGYFSLSANDLELLPDVEYYLKVLDRETREIYQSSKSTLPEKPKIQEVSADTIASSRHMILKVTLDEADTLIPGISSHFSRLDSAERIINPVDLFQKLRATYFSFPGDKKWTSLDFTQQADKVGENEDGRIVRVKYIEAEIYYLSEGLARFLFELKESYFFGEDIFQAVRPVHFNISGNHGVFGLYNETAHQIKIE